MAKIFEGFDESGFEDWLKTRPAVIQELGAKIRPNRLYRMTESGRRCYIISYSANGTVTVVVDGNFNRVAFSRQVFGVNPDTLVECDLPAEGEDVGDTAAEAGYTDDDIKNILIPKIRERLRANDGND